MNKKNKKIIAREFLVFLSMVGIGVIIFCCHYPYNWIQQKRIDKLNGQIILSKTSIDSLENPIHDKLLKHTRFYDEIAAKYDVSAYETPERLWGLMVSSIRQDSLKGKWTGRWKKAGITDLFERQGFKSVQELEDYILKNSLDYNDSLHVNRAEIYKNQVQKLSAKRNLIEGKILKGYRLDWFPIIIGIFLFAVMFLLRYLIYAIRWSRRQLKE